jgi:hypothetical protein
MFAPLVSPVDKAVIDLVARVAVWEVPGFKVDSFVHEVRDLDRHLYANMFVPPCRHYRLHPPSPTSRHSSGKQSTMMMI